MKFSFKKIFLPFLFLWIFSCSQKINDYSLDKKEQKCRTSALKIQQEIQKVNEKKMLAFEEFFSNLSDEQKVSQLFIENIEGDTVYVPVEKTTSLYEFQSSNETKPLIPGGYLFFSFNLKENPKEIMRFTNSIKKLCYEKNLVPPFLSIDQEGGYVNRLKIVSGPLPSQEKVAKHLSVEQAFKLYSTQAKQMKALGFDMNLAPVVEVCTQENKDFLDGRSFGSISDVEKYGKACVNAYELNGIGTVLKHFPGNSNTDPHSGLPEINLSILELEKLLLPFEKVLSLNPTGVLMSHARTTAIDGKNPACFSKEWIVENLRKQKGFKGIVFSDDIFMAALAKNGYPPETAAINAIEAGINCIMISEKRFAAPAYAILKKMYSDSNFLELVNGSAKKVLMYKLSCGVLSYSCDENGVLKVEIPFENIDFEKKLNDFNLARNENIDLYTDLF